MTMREEIVAAVGEPGVNFEDGRFSCSAYSFEQIEAAYAAGQRAADERAARFCDEYVEKSKIAERMLEGIPLTTWQAVTKAASATAIGAAAKDLADAIRNRKEQG